MTSPVLPEPLVHRIVSSADPHTLRACALVCRSWLPTARSHLFHTVVLKRRDACARFLAATRSAPDIANYVKKLWVIANVDGDDSEGSWSDLVPLLLAQNLANLALLLCRGVQWDKTELGARFYAALARLTSLKELRLYHCSFPCFRDLQTLLCAFPQLEDLSFWAVSWTSELPPAVVSPKAVPHTLRLKALRVKRSGTPLACMLDWVLSTPSWRSLRTIELHRVEKEEEAAATRFLRVLGPFLKHVTLGFHADLGLLDFDETILANCKALLSLQLTNVDFQGSVAWVYGCVLGLPPARIPRVSCKLWADTPRDLDVLRWKALDTVFTRSHSAVSIVLHSWKSPDMEKMCREVERRLPALYNRRQLEVSSHGPARLGSGARSALKELSVNQPGVDV
ncbi:hypothetical protein AcW1_003784 [Taiwanofungus camphoratus]|nr:hypothetical protein AcW1_003784 [Antrodia cinnamomea]